MKTIFSAQKKSLRFPSYVRVYAWHGRLTYDRYSTREDRERYEDIYRDYSRNLYRPLYRINVRPKS